ncbi:MAG: nitrate- and nitrite sensing domain-containing protein, partial [Streptosporangiaceae bacterium]
TRHRVYVIRNRKGHHARAVAPGEIPRGGEAVVVDRPRHGNSFALRNWHVRTRLIAVIMIPVIAAGILGGLRIASSWNGTATYGRVEHLARLGSGVVRVVHGLQTERALVAGYIASGRKGDTHAISAQRAEVRERVKAVRTQAEEIDSSYSPLVRDKVRAAESRLNDLSAIRHATLKTKLPTLAAITAYSSVISDLLTLNVEIAEGSGNSGLAEQVRALDAISRAKEQVSRQEALLYSALEVKRFAPGEYDRLLLARAQAQSALTEFESDASAQERQYYEDTVAGRSVDRVARLTDKALARGQNARLHTSAKAWVNAMSTKLDLMHTVEKGLVGKVLTRSIQLRHTAQRDLLADALIVLAVLLLAILAALFVARSMVGSLHRLRSSALEVAEHQLPEVVRVLRDSDGRDAEIHVEPTGIESSDEIGEVAQAFDEVHAEAVRLATEQATLRGNVNAMFVNLSRRSQSLVERQLRLIDDLETGEQDPDQLSSLFRLDHLATRMRRHGDNLLVLAGEDSGRHLTRAVPLIDVLRAGVSEVEQYERVEIRGLPNVEIIGRAVNDLVHLVAELLENATAFSPKDTKVLIAGELFTDGRVMVEIVDNGIGMDEREMAAVNTRLDTPPPVDVSVSRRMGLFVVSRLASRHGIRAQLRPSSAGGITALVMLPDTAAALRPVMEPAPPVAQPLPPAIDRTDPAPQEETAAAGPVPRQVVPSSAGAGASVFAARRPPDGGRTDDGHRTATADGSREVAHDDREGTQAESEGASDSTWARWDEEDTTESLPIFQSVESEWFRRRARGGRPPDDTRAPKATAQAQATARREPEPQENEPEPQEDREESWHSPGDEVWDAAQKAINDPDSSGVTAAGLPKRVPGRNLVPGSAGRQPVGAGARTSPRSAQTVGGRLASYHQGIQRGRHARNTVGGDETQSEDSQEGEKA